MKSERFFDVETWYRDDERSIAFIALNGMGQRLRNHRSRMAYEVISGEGDFVVERVRQHVRAGDNVRIPSAAFYEYEGDWLFMLATSSPPYDPDFVEVLID